MTTSSRTLATMRTMLAVLLLVAACTTEDPQPIPKCADVGCGTGPLLCTNAGVCRCPQVDSDPIECQREPAP